MESVETSKKPKEEKSMTKKRGERNRAITTRNRKPLADCTNTLLSPSSSSSSASNNNAITKMPLSSSLASIKTPLPIKPPTKPPPPPSTPNLPNDSNPCRPTALPSIFLDSGGDEMWEPRSVYSRRCNPDARKSSRGKEIAATGYKFAKDECNAVSKSSLTKPPAKRQRQKVNKDDSVHGLPSDFIKEQKAYFAEIDAYELLLEEVASVDELD